MNPESDPNTEENFVKNVTAIVYGKHPVAPDLLEPTHQGMIITTL